jgi:hypothetical protein
LADAGLEMVRGAANSPAETIAPSQPATAQAY